MALELPIYAIVGQKPMFMFHTEVGRIDHLVWDFDKKDWERGGANELDVLFGMEAPGGGEDTKPGPRPHDGTGDLRYVTETEFWEYVESLRERTGISETDASD